MKEINRWTISFQKHWKIRLSQLDDLLINLNRKKMKNNLMMEFSIDREKKQIHVKREFAAPLATVWAAWTQSEILDKWWAPKPWQSRTKEMDFRVGGHWLYAMVGPEGEEHWARADYKSIAPKESFSLLDAFCDANGNINDALARTAWTNVFSTVTAGTLVSMVLQYDNIEALDQIIAMGFKEGFTAGMENLDALLAHS